MHALSILVVDDVPANVHLLDKILRRAGYTQVRGTTSAAEAIAWALHEPPDILLLDLHMPEMSGVAVIRQLQQLDPMVGPFVVVLTADDSREAKAEALSAGAKDYITKPFDTAEILLRIRNLADMRTLQQQLQRSNRGLEAKVRARTAELEAARLDVLERLAMAAEFRDDATGRHTRRVGMIAGKLSTALGMTADEAGIISRAAPLHDVGKIAIPDRVLLKPGPLDAEEIGIMRMHTTTGAKLLSYSPWPLLVAAREVALTHHERWDGKGYPQGLAGNQIPVAGRIVALADFYDALSHDRPYRAKMSKPQILQLIDEGRAGHFDPDVVAAFFRIEGELQHGEE